MVVSLDINLVLKGLLQAQLVELVLLGATMVRGTAFPLLRPLSGSIRRWSQMGGGLSSGVQYNEKLYFWSSGRGLKHEVVSQEENHFTD